jgi:hypothetical protein
LFFRSAGGRSWPFHDEHVGSAWRLQELPEADLGLSEGDYPSFGRSFAVFYNQVRLGRLEVSAAYGYSASEPKVYTITVAQENDAERAARAALSIQPALAEVNRKNPDSRKPALSARIGIETGPVVVDAAGEIYGDAPSTAARVQALAEPGTVVVTAQVQREIAGLFVAEERGTHDLKGVSEPVTLFQLVRASGGGRRTGQRHLTPLVGRDEEIAMLMRRWERARQGDGQLVMIVGEPGLGKSRLIEEFHSRLRDTPHTWGEWSCSQLLQNTPLHPIADTRRPSLRNRARNCYRPK